MYWAQKEMCKLLDLGKLDKVRFLYNPHPVDFASAEESITGNYYHKERTFTIDQFEVDGGANGTRVT